MDAENWPRLVIMLLSNPEKIALGLVIGFGAWRWIRELWREMKDDSHHESLVDTLMKENRELRDELRKERQEHEHHD